jgi:hypothetical protein
VPDTSLAGLSLYKHHVQEFMTRQRERQSILAMVMAPFCVPKSHK